MEVWTQKISYQQLFYLSMANRLFNPINCKRYEMTYRINIECCHPSYEKHGNTLIMYFILLLMNQEIYLGLCINGFSPFGPSVHNYSLCHVIITMYNLPPGIMTLTTGISKLYFENYDIGKIINFNIILM